MKKNAMRVSDAPQSAGKRIAIRMNDIDVNQVVLALVLQYPIAIIAAHEPDIIEAGKTIGRFREDVSLVDGVFISREAVHPDDLLKKA